jgi:hypothetical protein
MTEYPQLLHTVFDTTRPRELAEFHRPLLGLSYRPGDEPPVDEAPDDSDWLVLVNSDGLRKLAFQQIEHLPRTTWPEHDVPMQLHVDLTVTNRAESTGSVNERWPWAKNWFLTDRCPDEPLYVFADLSGHRFCIFIA